MCPAADVIRVVGTCRMRWAGHVARMGEKRHAYRVLVGKLRNELLGGPRGRWEDNINP